jgi:hypothetical protein
MSASTGGLTRLRALRLIPALETYPSLVARVQTVPGKLVLLVLFGALLAVLSPTWAPVMLFLTLSTFLPAHRRVVLTVGSLVFSLVLPNLLEPAPIRTAMTAVVLALGAVLYAASRRWPQAPLLSRPVRSLLVGTALFVAWVGWQPGAFAATSWAWQLAGMLVKTQYFIAYALLDRLSAQADSTMAQVGTFMPYWGGAITPYPKGAANLRKIEAKDAEALAVTQLKGFKLLLWSAVLAGGYRAFEALAFTRLELPTLDQTLGALSTHTPPTVLECWEALLGNFALQLFHLSVLGHRIIACCRMAGFAALRNTYRPLEARTIAEFWNRYYYYFKELLVDVFYYPAFVRYFKKTPVLRRNFAVFAAVFFGNLYYHFFRSLSMVQTEGFVAALKRMDVYAVQCLMLACAISISQEYNRNRPPARGPLALVRVSLFYCVMFAFVDESFTFPLRVHLRFFGRMLGLDV